MGTRGRGGGRSRSGTAERQGMVAAAFFWPGTEAPIGGLQPSLWRAFDGGVANRHRVEPESYRLVVDAKGRQGFVRGEAHITLADGTDGHTVVSVDGRGQIGGMIARVGQRLVGAVGKTMMDRFFDCLSKKASAVSS